VKWSLKFSAESIQKPNHRVAPLLKDMKFPFPILIFFLRFRCWFFFTNRMASVFVMSNCTVFCSAHRVEIFAHFSRVSAISITLAPEAIQDRSSTEVIAAVPASSSTSSKTHDMYIANRMGDIGEPWGMPEFVGVIAVSWPLIISDTFLSFMKVSIHLISCRLASSSSMRLVSLVLDTWSKAPFMSMRIVPAIFPFPSFGILLPLGMLPHLLLSNAFCFLQPNWPLYSFLSIVSAGREVTTFSTIFPIQFSRHMILYASGLL
jgi:hypothetical protein